MNLKQETEKKEIKHYEAKPTIHLGATRTYLASPGYSHPSHLPASVLPLEQGHQKVQTNPTGLVFFACQANQCSTP